MQRSNQRYRSGGKINLPSGYLSYNTRINDYKNMEKKLSSPYDNYSTGVLLCKVPPRNSYAVVNQSVASNNYYKDMEQQPMPLNTNLNNRTQPTSLNTYLNNVLSPAHFPYQRYNITIAEEERQRILTIRRDQEEEFRRNQRLLEEHARLQQIRAGETNSSESQVDQNIPSRVQVNQNTNRNQIPNANDFDWDEMLEEIVRPPPDYNYENDMRNINQSSRNLLDQNFVKVDNRLDKDSEKRKKLYDRNIDFVTEIAKYKWEEPCSVCYDEEPNNMMIMVCCKQYFCFACISAWWKEKKTCPACRMTDPVFIEITGKEIRHQENSDNIKEKLNNKEENIVKK